jgi:hypothetical protein
VLHADETPVQQLDPGNGKTKRAYLWAYRSNALASDPPIVVFDYQPGRGGKYVAEFLADWQGALMVDEFAGYQALFRGEVIELACLAHARRKFFDLHQANGSPLAAEALRRIGELYAIEDAAKGKTVEERARRRKETSQPLLEALHLWLQNTRRSVADGGALAKAIDYSLRRWPALGPVRHERFLPDRQQPGRECHSPDRHREEELAVRRLRGGRPTRRGDSIAARNRPHERHRADGLADRHPGETPLLAEQPHRRVAAAQKASVILRAQGWVR